MDFISGSSLNLSTLTPMHVYCQEIENIKYTFEKLSLITVERGITPVHIAVCVQVESSRYGQLF